MTKFNELDLLAVGNTIQQVGAVYAGEGQVFLCMFPGEHGCVYPGDGTLVFFQGDAEIAANREAGVDTLNMSLEEWQQFLRQTDIMEVEVLAAAADGKTAKAILRKSARQISQHISWEVFRRDGYRCRYCGKDTVPLTVDHLVTWEDGGPSIPENLVSADKRCNKVRGNLPYAQWLECPYYKKVSANLTGEQREANRRLAETLDQIPRMIHKPTRRK